MIQKLKLRQATIIFNIIATIVLVGSVALFYIFEQTKQDIQTTSINSQIQYIDDITDNIAKTIQNATTKSVYETLKNSSEKRAVLEYSLQLLITKRYKYVYVVDKEENDINGFRFLLDGAKERNEKSEFEEPYTPLNIDAWNKVYKTKKEAYFTHDGMKNVWITYLKPIIIDNKVSAIIVIDFSLQTSEIILSTLSELSISFKLVLLFSIIIFFVIVGFSYADSRREKLKKELYEELVKTNRVLQDKTEELEEKSAKISQFNKTLEEKVKEEVAKNREKDKQMFHQSRLAQMGEMIGMIAHQWRQPLAAISSASTAVQLKATLKKLESQEIIELSNKISGYTQHLSATIDDFRDFFKPNKEKMETNFIQILQSVLGIVETSMQDHNIKIIKDLKCDKNFISYSNELKQVILNLLKNAQDVLIEKDIQNPYIKIATYNKDETIVLEVSDNGGGIPLNIIDNIFDPYFSTKTNKDGTGLGLYMSKTIVETHCGGILSVVNGVEGAVFKIILKTDIK